VRWAALAGGLAILCAGGIAVAQRSETVLPTEWSIPAAPASEAITGTLPQSATLTADGSSVIVTDTGAGTPAVRVFNAQTLALEHVVGLQGAYGQPLADPQAAGFWVSTGGANTIVHIDAHSGAIERTISLPPGFWPAAIARSPDGRSLAVTGESAGAVAVIDMESGATVTVPVGRHPAGVAWSPDGMRVYVALWGEDSLAIVDLQSISGVRGPGGAPQMMQAMVKRVRVGRHPESIVAGPGGTNLYITVPDDDSVAWFETEHDTLRGVVNVGLYSGVLFGASPSFAAVSADGSRVFVACSAANAIAVLRQNAASLEPIGAIRTGWYPTALAIAPDARSLYVANGKGDGSFPNPGFDPYAADRAARTKGYIATSIYGSIWHLDIPGDAALAAGTAGVVASGGPFLGRAIADIGVRQHGPPGGDPGHDVIRANGPIKHVIYVIKENRTYDQVLGDVRDGDGDATLALFGERTTPNQHAIVRRFGLLDRAFADAQVSADGHNWSTAAFANEYLEKMWPAAYGGRRDTYDFEDGADASVPRGGYIWDQAARAGVSLRNYGEFTSTRDGRVTSTMPGLAERTDPQYPGFDLTVLDADRIARWKTEFDSYVREGSLPALEIVRLPNDHTAGTKLGAPGPQVYVAENDAAFGKLVDIVSHSRYWASTAIFAIEDDAQNGPDHVSPQRTTLYVASPYARAGVHHLRYSTAGLLRTIELILGLEPLSAYDASALPLYGAFTNQPDLRPFDSVAPQIDMSLRNGPRTYRVADSGRFDFSREDGVPDAELNDILWHAVRGAHATPPPYGAFPANDRHASRN
jgi:DNA-binding beta-propeller fold protein YncE